MTQILWKKTQLKKLSRRAVEKNQFARLKKILFLILKLITLIFSDNCLLNVFGLRSWFQFNCLHNLVSTPKKRNSQKTKLGQLNETLDVFVVSNNTNASALGYETVGPRNNNCSNFVGRIIVGESNESQNQVKEHNIDDRNKKSVDNRVMTVENGMIDPISTAMDNVVIPKVDIAVRSTTESSRRGLSSVGQYLDQRNFTRITESNPFI